MRLWLFLRFWSLLWHIGLPVVLAYLWMYATFNLFPGAASTTGGGP